eukprot:434340-Amphidinium_carterae.1
MQHPCDQPCDPGLIYSIGSIVWLLLVLFCGRILNWFFESFLSYPVAFPLDPQFADIADGLQFGTIQDQNHSKCAGTTTVATSLWKPPGVGILPAWKKPPKPPKPQIRKKWKRVPKRLGIMT